VPAELVKRLVSNNQIEVQELFSIAQLNDGSFWKGLNGQDGWWLSQNTGAYPCQQDEKADDNTRFVSDYGTVPVTCPKLRQPVLQNSFI